MRIKLCRCCPSYVTRWEAFFVDNFFGVLQVALTLQFTRFHFTRFTLYTRLRFLPNEFTLCNTLHVFLTLHCQKYYLSSTKLLCFTLHEFQFTRFIQKNKNRVKWGLPVHRYSKYKVSEIKQWFTTKNKRKIVDRSQNSWHQKSWTHLPLKIKDNIQQI